MTSGEADELRKADAEDGRCICQRQFRDGGVIRAMQKSDCVVSLQRSVITTLIVVKAFVK